MLRNRAFLDLCKYQWAKAKGQRLKAESGEWLYFSG